MYVFQGSVCQQAGEGLSSSVVAGYGGGSSVSLDDAGNLVPITNGISFSGGLKAGLSLSGGKTYTDVSGC